MTTVSALTLDEQKLVVGIFANDGHTIYTTKYLANLKCPSLVINEFRRPHKSDRANPKTTITVNNVVVDRMWGVYGLSVLWSLASYYNITSDKMGRGFQAADLTKQLQDKFIELTQRVVRHNATN